CVRDRDGYYLDYW
nr:immunoglobulin heavy chain junction region [Mus musculus]MBK4196380.1 immunoglobulin heavy chain junction region [Mus musculus]MBK4196381.1 immunoglobulin heavy chain junction region [Mus musculus]